jgi:integrase
MLHLANGCKCSDLSVYPKNWKKNNASVEKPWYISYRFYDPRYPKPKLVALRGMNIYSTASARRKQTEQLMEMELDDLLNRNYNPFTKTTEEMLDGAISRDMLFIDALREGRKRLKYVHKALVDIDSIISHFEQSAIKLRLINMTISETSRKHIKILLDHQFKVNPRFTAKRYNKYRAYLLGVFKELVELEAIDMNPVRDISKMKETTKLRLILSKEQRTKIDKHLKENNYRFWLFTNIFFHSGGRETELMNLKGADVDLKRQRYKCLVKKGVEYREVERTIKDVAVPFWKEAIEGCKPEQVIFSKHLKAGAKAIRPDQITRRWQTWVKDENKRGLGIKVDFYALKHLNTDDTAALLGIEDAARHNSHTSTNITLRYAVNEKERQHERLKQVNNSFS